MTKKIRLVDGFLIRSTLDPDFGVLHENSIQGFAAKYYIPHNEIWMDKQFKKEKDFLLQFFHLSHDKKYANWTYQKWREMVKKTLTTPGNPPNFVHKEERKKGLKIQYVDGATIRQYFDPEFIFGGHKFVYEYVPPKTIWLDIHQDEKEMPYTLIHEMVEYEHMKKGMTYDQAHDIATAYDKAQRRADKVGRYPGDATYTKKDILPYAQKK